jgi:twitching motility protein PilT
VIAQNLLNRKDGSGRVPAMEVLRNNKAVANLIRTGAWHQIDSTIETQGKDGMITLERHLAELVKAGVVSREEAIRYVGDSSFSSRLD